MVTQGEMSADLQTGERATGQSGQSARIEIKGVGKRYGDLQVFQDINLEFNEREIVTLVGGG